ncbi:MAG: DUF4861 family protein [Pontiellaceae bacterium]|nr:DUF4861 family protein [Pontiellaceae bacterium]MBN2784505.1 DUF4861 family protein [Pontiellaceae bacterium]
MRLLSCALKVGFVITLLLSGSAVFAENKTDVSLKWKDSDRQESEIRSETGDLYTKVAHHGPAVENEWLGIRIYYDKKCVFDAYNKTRPGLELAEASWYPTEEQQKGGWGADQYKVGPTVGLGGVRLWDGQKVVWLDPVNMRIARVRKEACFSYAEMLSEGVPYKGGTVDVLVRVTAFSGMREMKVEAFALCDEPVQFVTGINYWPKAPAFEGEGCMGSWGIHPEDVAAIQLNIGGGLVYDPTDFAEKKKTDGEILLISRPTKYLSTWITGACEKEDGFSSGDAFEAYVKHLTL